MPPKARNFPSSARLANRSAVRVSLMVSIVCVVVHPSRVIRAGLKTILSKSAFEPVHSGSSIDELPPGIAGGNEQVLVLLGVRDADQLGAALTAAKARFPE